MADKVKVFDATGVEREVHPVDAREIVAAGGSMAAGHVVPDTKRKEKVTHPAEVNLSKSETLVTESPATEEVATVKAKPRPKPKS